MVDFATNTAEAILLQFKHRYESLSVVGLASCIFTNGISEAVLLQLKHSYESVSLYRGPRKRSLYQ